MLGRTNGPALFQRARLGFFRAALGTTVGSRPNVVATPGAQATSDPSPPLASSDASNDPDGGKRSNQQGRQADPKSKPEVVGVDSAHQDNRNGGNPQRRREQE